jgi:ABC-type polysaccharide/polyol phosphate transport system ATPase subunit
MDPSVSVTGVSKKYLLYDSPRHRLTESLFPFIRKKHRAFWALKNVSFDVRKGQALGILGRNGSGKSTLLQVICGILRPTAGEVRTAGRISALLELGAGFNPEYSGRANVYMNLALMGFSKQEIADRFEDIARFADIGQFMEQPVKIYSSGMFVRLAFACAAIVEPDILVVDEALAVGDVFFQQKCFDRLREANRRGTTCIFVSHDTGAMANLCDDILVLAEGELAFRGNPQEAVSRYCSTLGSPVAGIPQHEMSRPPVETTHAADSAAEILAHNILTGGNRHGPRDLEVVAARVMDTAGNDTLTIGTMDRLIFHVLTRAKKAITNSSVGIHIYDRMSNLVFASGTIANRIGLPDLAAGEELIVRMMVTFNVQAGEYIFNLGCSAPTGTVQDRHEMLGPITVLPENLEVPHFWGIARLPMQIEVSRPAAKKP